jgi:O-antigen/teichoic acid export membrane protein
VDYFGAILRGHERFRQEAVMNAVRALATAACAVASLRVFGTVKALGVGMLVGSFVSAAWGLFVLPDRAARRPLPDVLRAVVTEAVPLWLSGLLAMLYFRSDIVIVRAFSGEAEVGAYAAAYRIFEATLIVPASVMAVVFPRLVRSSGGGRTTRLEVAVTAGLLLVGVVVAAVLLVADDRIVALLLGKTFDRSAPSLRVLAFTVPVMFASFALCTFVIARGRERPFAWALAAMLLLNVGLNLRLVRSLDGVGAAWSTLFTELALVALCLFILTVGRSSSKSR